MITNEQAAKMFEQPTIEAVPTDMKRIIIPAYGFAGARDAKREEWGADGPFMEDVKGLVFHNPKDNCEQVLKQKDGCLICYDAPGRKEKINRYIEQHPETFNNIIHLNKFINYLKENVVNEGGKADLWDTDVNFAAGLKDAPAKEDIKIGKVFSSVKKKKQSMPFWLIPVWNLKARRELLRLRTKTALIWSRTAAASAWCRKPSFSRLIPSPKFRQRTDVSLSANKTPAFEWRRKCQQ